MSLTIATFNVWFDNYYLYQRLNNMIRELLQSKQVISVIALQEVTPVIFTYIKSSPLMKIYNSSKEEITQTYDTILLVHKKYTINMNNSKKFTNTRMARGLEYLSITDNIQHKNFIIATSHLESEFNNNNNNKNNNNKNNNNDQNDSNNTEPSYKLSQFQEAFIILNKMDDNKIKSSNSSYPRKYDLIIFMGDMNISNREDQTFNKKIPDMWYDYFIDFGSPKYLEFTYDYTKNNNASYRVKSRLDRIYYKNNNQSIKPYSFSFLGQEPSNDGFFSSDHFGLLATFHYVS